MNVHILIHYSFYFIFSIEYLWHSRGSVLPNTFIYTRLDMLILQWLTLPVSFLFAMMEDRKSFTFLQIWFHVQFSLRSFLDSVHKIESITTSYLMFASMIFSEDTIDSKDLSVRLSGRISVERFLSEAAAPVLFECGNILLLSSIHFRSTNRKLFLEVKLCGIWTRTFVFFLVCCRIIASFTWWTDSSESFVSSVQSFYSVALSSLSD